jgi:hypothetical protein
MEELFFLVTKLPTAASWRCSKQSVPLQGTCGVPSSQVCLTSEVHLRYVASKLKISELLHFFCGHVMLIFEVLTTLLWKIQVLRDVKLCCSATSYWCLMGSSCLLLQCQAVCILQCYTVFLSPQFPLLPRTTAPLCCAVHVLVYYAVSFA